ncbi:MAG TPA: hypothetical protein VFD39_05795 [Trueperaceae bacterium]|nr:hypothetical protein [Trueperaceae bacterium]
MPEHIARKDFVDTFLVLLDETFVHPPRAEGSAYLDRDVSWRQTLATLDADKASQPITAGGTSVAAQLGHALYYLEVLEQFIHGGKPKLDWPGSWSRSTVSPEEWEGLKDDFNAAYERLRTHWRSAEKWDDDALGDALTVLVHSAYHLGAVRQIVRVVGGV